MEWLLWLLQSLWNWLPSLGRYGGPWASAIALGFFAYRTYKLQRGLTETKLEFSGVSQPYRPSCASGYEVARILVKNIGLTKATGCKGELVSIDPLEEWFTPVRLIWAIGGNQEGAIDIGRDEENELFVIALRVGAYHWGKFYLCHYGGPEHWTEIPISSLEWAEYTARIRVIGDNFSKAECVCKLSVRRPIAGIPKAQKQDLEGQAKEDLKLEMLSVPQMGRWQRWRHWWRQPVGSKL